MIICDRCKQGGVIHSDFLETKTAGEKTINVDYQVCETCQRYLNDEFHRVLNRNLNMPNGTVFEYSIPPRPILWWKHLAIAVLGGAIGAMGILVLYLNHVRHH